MHMVESMFSVREKPWHGLGQVLLEPPTSEEAIKQAGLDWEVEGREIFWKSKMNNMRFIPVPQRQMLVRTRDELPLSVVSSDYRVLQNVEAFQFFDPLVTAGIAVYETAGSLQQGKKIWILARIKKEFQIGPNDVVRQYVLLCNGHDGSTGILLQPTGIRVVCKNTLMNSLSTGMVIRMVHRGDVHRQMQMAQEVIGFTENRFKQLQSLYVAFNAREITTEERIGYLKALIPDAPSNASPRLKARVAGQRDGILRLLDTGESVKVTGINRGTIWAIYNCAVEFADWCMGERARDFGNYQLFGHGALFKQRALDIAGRLLKGESLTKEPVMGLPDADAEAANMDID